MLGRLCFVDFGYHAPTRKGEVELKERRTFGYLACLITCQQRSLEFWHRHLCHFSFTLVTPFRGTYCSMQNVVVGYI